LIVKSSSPEFSPDDLEWAFVNLDAPLLERALARRRIFLQAQAQDDQLYEMYWWDNSPNFFALYPDMDTDQSIEEASLEDKLCNDMGQPIELLYEDLYRVSEETAIPDVYLRAVECARMRVDTYGIAWVCHPKHLDAGIRTSTIPWEVIEEQRLFPLQPNDR
jgi:hypothetical protein